MTDADSATATANSWFADARFGLFVHWGMYSAQGWEPSWPLVGGVPIFPQCQSLTVEEYYAKEAEFTPPPGAPHEWIRAAKACGMTYAVLTTKHHDGWALFDCEAAPYGVRTFLPGRDLVGEFVEAARAEGLRVGLYYSLSDWHHADYPPFRDDMRPYGFSLPRTSPEAWARFVADQRAQLRHLMTAYGTIDLIWFDGGWERSADEWGAADIEALLREINPAVVINDRLPGAGDYETPEQGVPHTRPARAWETCMTMAESWGPIADDLAHKSVRYLLSILAEVTSAGGNLLLNISPDGDGRMPAWQQERLAGIAEWMSHHAAVVHGSAPGLEPWQFHGPTTRQTTVDGAEVLHLWCTMRPQEMAVLRGVPGRRVRSARAVGSNTPLTWTLRQSALDHIIGNRDTRCDVLIETPQDALDDLLTVLEVVIDP